MRKIGMWFAIGTVGALCFSPIGATQTEDELLAVEQEFNDAVNAHDVDKIMTYFTDDSVYDFVPQPPAMNGKEEITAFIEGLFAGMPDFNIVERHNHVAGNILVREAVLQATHLGVLSGIPPTGNSLQILPFHIFEFEGTQVKKSTEYLDMQSLLIQMGVMPAAELPPLEPSFTLPDPEPSGISYFETAIESDSRWNSGDLNSFIKLYPADADFLIAPLGIPLDRSAYVAAQEIYSTAFPNRIMETVRRIDCGDGWVVTEVIFKGTHDGPYFGIPATGQPFAVRGVNIVQANDDGFVTYLHTYYDGITLLAQLGLMPTSSSSEAWELYK